MLAIALHRICRVFGITIAVVLVLVLCGTADGRNALAWIYLQSTEAIANATHIRAISLDRFDPTCPQCM
jgi:predicted metal-binding protein